MFAAPSGSGPDALPLEVHPLLARAELSASADRIAEARSLYGLAIERDRSQTARHAFGCFLTRTGCDEEARSVFATVLEETRRTGDNRLRAAVANNLAALHRQRGERAVAAGYQQQAVSAETSSLETGGELSGHTLFGCAGDALLAGQIALADNLFRRSLAKHVAEQSIDGQADIRGSLGVVAAMTGDPNRAERCLWDAYSLHRDADDRPGAAVDLMNMAALFETTAQWPKMILCLTLAAELLEQTGNRSLCLQARGRLEQVIRVMAVRKRDPLRN